MRVRALLLLGLTVAAVRWRLQPRWLRTAAGYWLRPYCWRLDERHWRWQHRACLAQPCLLDLRTLAERDSDFEIALQRLTQRLPDEAGS